ncbi:Putative rhamnose biosynthetic enzyme 1 [Durusdinium trenchii]|uniref:Rhamnose biosynthetic enzyme 1 n=1 Tax=Durusdinium trenchii TaxID=1381693 RepID=A0ABP0PLN6_9DINO
MLRLQVGSLFWSGLPCSLHVWVSRGTSGKTRSNPRGNPDKHDCTKEANMIAARFALCILICLARGVWWICEQPVSSVAMYLHYIEHAIYPARTMLGFQAGFIQKFWMGLFGHRSLKRTVIFGDAPFIHMFSLAARVTQADREKHQWSSDGNMKVTVNKSTGKKSVSGGPKLKDTQSYPIRFCSRIAEYFKKYCVESQPY